MSSLFCLFLCLSLHACSARHLRVVEKEKNKGMQSEDLVCIGTHLCFSQENGDLSEEIVPRDIRSDASKVSMVETEEPKAVELAWKESKISSTQLAVEKISQVTYLEEIARRVLKATPNDAEERVDSNEGDTVEDVVEMDYAQPHRKQPIHNKET